MTLPSQMPGSETPSSSGWPRPSGFSWALLGLPRDFWIVVTIITAARTKFGPTLSSASMIVGGTIAGALMAAAITLSISDVYVLEACLLVFGTAMFATRGVNLGLTQVLITPFIIILLNLLYPGEWWLALFRVLDVTLGGAIVIAVVYLLSIRSTIQGVRGGGAAADGAPRGRASRVLLHSSLSCTPSRFDRFWRSWAT